jgi:hypothetical protein
MALTAGIALYAALEFKFAQMIGSYYFLLQAIWIAYCRLRPQQGSLFEVGNLRSAGLSAATGFCLAFVQIILQFGSLRILASMGVITLTGDGTGPGWIYGLVWGAFYFEMAYWLPIARKRGMSGGV